MNAEHPQSEEPENKPHSTVNTEPVAELKPVVVETNGHLPAPPAKSGKAVETWHRILRLALAMPGAHVDRDTFLRSVLRKHLPKEQVDAVIETSPAKAGVDPELIESIATKIINNQTYQVTAASFVAGIPGGALMAAMVPADIAQFYYQSLILCQKLAYLYGWPDLLEDRKVDDNTLMHMTMFVGVMLGAAAANIGVAHMAEAVARKMVTDLPKRAIADQAITNLVVQVGKWIDIRVTRRNVSQGLGKVIPVIGAVMSAGMSYASMRPMARRLRRHLASLPLATGQGALPPSASA